MNHARQKKHETGERLRQLRLSCGSCFSWLTSGGAYHELVGQLLAMPLHLEPGYLLGAHIIAMQDRIVGVGPAQMILLGALALISRVIVDAGGKPGQ